MRHDWQIQVRMLDGKDNEDDRAAMKEVEKRLSERFRLMGDSAGFTMVKDGLGVTSDIFDTKIQENLEEWWDGIFDKAHTYFVLAMTEELRHIGWRIEGGKCVKLDQAGWEWGESYEYVDAYGNRCETDTSCINVWGAPGSERIYAMAVKKWLETGKGSCYDFTSFIQKWPPFLKSYIERQRRAEKEYKEEEYSEDEQEEFSEFLDNTLSDCLRVQEIFGWLQFDNPFPDGFLLDKDGNRVTAVKDFDHSEPDKDGTIYYPVSGSDFVDKDTEKPLTEEAEAKWRKRLGL